MSQVARQSHLAYYREHQITPVRYDLSSIDAHLERRYSLYLKLGLLPLTFRGANVLEVAAGTGHNSLFLAQTMPKKLVLLEPNIHGVDHIREAYQSFNRPHTSPELVIETLEEYAPSETFDVVLCENWLGTSQHEQALLQKLSEMVSFEGVLVLTTVSPVGFVPNVLRRLLSMYIAPLNNTFQQRTDALVSAFAPHLNTLSAMTRNHTDWVQDNMINPAYFGLCLSIPNLIEKLGDHFDVLGSSPVFSEDWRWFKGMHSSMRQFNKHFLSEYWKKSHNFLDHREEPASGDQIQNINLETMAFAVLNSVAAHEDAHISQSNIESTLMKVIEALDDFISSIPTHLSASIEGLQEVRHLLESPRDINVERVAALKVFSGLFGRETVYVSLTRVQ